MFPDMGHMAEELRALHDRMGATTVCLFTAALNLGVAAIAWKPMRSA